MPQYPAFALPDDSIWMKSRIRKAKKLGKITKIREDY